MNFVQGELVDPDTGKLWRWKTSSPGARGGRGSWVAPQSISGGRHPRADTDPPPPPATLHTCPSRSTCPRCPPAKPTGCRYRPTPGHQPQWTIPVAQSAQTPALHRQSVHGRPIRSPRGRLASPSRARTPRTRPARHLACQSAGRDLHGPVLQRQQLVHRDDGTIDYVNDAAHCLPRLAGDQQHPPVVSSVDCRVRIARTQRQGEETDSRTGLPPPLAKPLTACRRSSPARERPRRLAAFMAARRLRPLRTHPAPPPDCSPRNVKNAGGTPPPSRYAVSGRNPRAPPPHNFPPFARYASKTARVCAIIGCGG